MSFVTIIPLDERIFGDFSYSGEVHKESSRKTKIASYLGAKSFNMPGMGCILNLDDPEEKMMYDCITEGYELKPFFVGKPDGTRGSSQRFKIEDQQADAAAYLANRKKKKELEKFIDGLKDKRLMNFALIMGLSGSEEMVRSQLLMMLDSDDDREREKLAKYVYHKDRNILELLHVAKLEGKPTEKQGVYKTGQGLYYFNDIPMGLGEDAAVAFLKADKNSEIYQALKDAYFRESEAGTGSVPE